MRLTLELEFQTEHGKEKTYAKRFYVRKFDEIMRKNAVLLYCLP